MDCQKKEEDLQAADTFIKTHSEPLKLPREQDAVRMKVNNTVKETTRRYERERL